MLNHKQITIIGGVAVACVAAGTTILWYSYKRKQTRKSVINLSHLWPYNLSSKDQDAATFVISCPEDFEKVLDSFVQELQYVKVIGFDCEWTSKSGKPQPVALLQLSTVSGLSLLIRLCHYRGPFPVRLQSILSDASYIKVGVGPIEDANKLLHDYGIVVSGCVDLRGLAVRTKETKNSLGLKSLAQSYLGVTMNKQKHIQCSAWDAPNLSKEQIDYAANDALIAAKVFSVIARSKLESNLHLASALNDAVNNTLWSIVSSYCQGLVDCKFKQRNQSHKQNNSQNVGNNLNFKPFKLYSTRKQPLYDNCKLQAPDGQLLATCDRKKANWYIEKELADIVTETPFTIRLRFEPAGRPASDRDYYLYDKQNVCVVCGSNGAIVRKNVVPHEYRRHFPLLLKDHVSHDIVPLCVACHQRAGYYDNILRNQIADEYKAPLGSAQAVQMLEDPERRSVRSAGKALDNARDRIPEPRKGELEKVLMDYYEVTSLSKELIKEASILETRYHNEAYIPHGFKVIDTIQSENSLHGLIDFEKRWREHFLATMNPQHLPHLWSVEHNHDRVIDATDVATEKQQ
ncbi:exonuclease 3'-5' domain-containing protein 2-like isoform X1 [Ciona intestinalis]